MHGCVLQHCRASHPTTAPASVIKVEDKQVLDKEGQLLNKKRKATRTDCCVRARDDGGRPQVRGRAGGGCSVQRKVGEQRPVPSLSQRGWLTAHGCTCACASQAVSRVESTDARKQRHGGRSRWRARVWFRHPNVHSKARARWRWHRRRAPPTAVVTTNFNPPWERCARDGGAAGPPQGISWFRTVGTTWCVCALCLLLTANCLWVLDGT